MVDLRGFFSRLRLVNRMSLSCPVCGYNFKFNSRVGISLDISVEMFMFLLGVIVGGMLRLI